MHGLIVKYQHGIAETAELITVLNGQLIGFHDEVVASESGSRHEQGRHRMIEIGYHAVGQTEVVWWEDKLVGPSVILLQHSVCAYGGLRCLDNARSDGADMMAFLLCRVHDRASLGTYRHLLGVHLVLRQVLYLYAMEVAEATMKCDESRLDAFYLHTLEQFATEMQSCRRCCYGTFVLCEYGLEVLHVLACGTRGLRFPVSVINDIAWQRCLAQRIKLLLNSSCGQS